MINVNKFKRQLKKFYMEKEFIEWMKKEPVISKKFKIHSRVRVIGGEYNVTKEGSKGRIVDLEPSSMFACVGNPEVRVEFYELKGDRTDYGIPCKFNIERRHLELIP